MVGHQKLSKEEKKDLVDLVKNQIYFYLCGEVERLFTNVELGKIYGVCGDTIRNHLKLSLIEEERDYRTFEICNNIFITKCSHNPEFQKKHEERSRNFMNFMNQDIKFQEKRIGMLIKRHQDPEYKEENRKRFRETMIKRHQDPEYKEENRKRMIKLLQDPNFIERCIEGSIKSRKKFYFVENRFYTQSQQEGAVALLIEDYIIGKNKINEGVNFQVRDKGINNGGIDFLLEDFLEWHPTILSKKSKEENRNDIPSEEYKSYLRVLASLINEDKKEFKEDYKKVLAINYRNKRQEAVDNSEYKGLEVKLATNIQEFYDFISKQKLIEQLPSFDEFKREFNEKVKYVKTFKVEKNQETKAA
ncbi:MAG: hypothetical protein WC413_04230 [Candidatus Nanoarchaeia archaeon]